MKKTLRGLIRRVRFKLFALRQTDFLALLDAQGSDCAQVYEAAMKIRDNSDVEIINDRLLQQLTGLSMEEVDRANEKLVAIGIAKKVRD
jgi:hypothetical protein